MEAPHVFLILAGFITLAIFIRLIAGGIDDDRVRRYVEARGGRLLTKHWNPFGKGWFGEKDARIYDLRYVDSDGNVHEATCKTSMFSGVYFTEDRIVDRAKQPADNDDKEHDLLAAENRQLREELARIRKEQG